MNIALGAILLTILLLPGAIAKRAYYSSIFEKESSIEIPFNDLLLQGIFFSIILHFFALLLLNFFYSFRLTLLYDIFIGKDLLLNDIEFQKQLIRFLLYNISIMGFSFLIGKIIRQIVKINNWDIRIPYLKTANYWFLIFNNRYLSDEEADFIILDVLTDTNIIYSGILDTFNYSARKDQLENIVLNSVVKRTFEKQDNPHPDRTTGIEMTIPGDLFIIPMEKIRNINVFYITAEDEEEEEEEDDDE